MTEQLINKLNGKIDTAYAFIIHDSKGKHLLSYQTYPKMEMKFKNKVISLEEFAKILENIKK